MLRLFDAFTRMVAYALPHEQAVFHNKSPLDVFSGIILITSKNVILFVLELAGHSGPTQCHGLILGLGGSPPAAFMQAIVYAG